MEQSTFIKDVAENGFMKSVREDEEQDYKKVTDVDEPRKTNKDGSEKINFNTEENENEHVKVNSTPRSDKNEDEIAEEIPKKRVATPRNMAA
jgi:hypothetical protein